MMCREQIEDLVARAIEAYEEAAGKWTGADWTHDYVRPCHAPEHGTYEPCPACRSTGDQCTGDGEFPDCQTREDAAGAAEAAEEAAADAVAALRAGDYEEALARALDASYYESRFGEDPTWGPLRSWLEEIVEVAADLAEGDA